MNSKKQLMVFVMGAAVLLTLATSLIVVGHYWEMLSGIWLIAILGVLLPDWVSFWGSKWYAAEDEDRRVKFTAFVVTLLMAVTMTLNAAAILAVKYEDKIKGELAAMSKEQEQVKETGKTDRVKERAQQVKSMRAAGASEATIRTFLRTEADRDKAESFSGEEKAAPKEFKSEIPEPIKKYMAFWVYFVPFLVGLIGKFALGFSIMLPGGAEFGKPTAKSEPRRAPGLAPAPTNAQADTDPK